VFVLLSVCLSLQSFCILHPFQQELLLLILGHDNKTKNFVYDLFLRRLFQAQIEHAVAAIRSGGIVDVHTGWLSHKRANEVINECGLNAIIVERFLLFQLQARVQTSNVLCQANGHGQP